jgi:WD40 repeat protein
MDLEPRADCLSPGAFLLCPGADYVLSTAVVDSIDSRDVVISGGKRGDLYFHDLIPDHGLGDDLGGERTRSPLRRVKIAEDWIRTVAVDQQQETSVPKQCIVGCDDGSLTLLDIPRTLAGGTFSSGTSGIIHRKDGAHSGEVRCVKVFPGSSDAYLRFLSCGETSGTVRLWDFRDAGASGCALTGSGEFSRNGHTGLVSGLAIAPDGQTFCSCSFDSSARLWDVRRTDAPVSVLSFPRNQNLFGCVFTPDGARVVVACAHPGKVWLDPFAGGEHSVEGEEAVGEEPVVAEIRTRTNPLAIAISNSGDILALGGTAGLLHLYCAPQTPAGERGSHRDTDGTDRLPTDIRALSFSSSGNVLAVGVEGAPRNRKEPGTQVYRRREMSMIKAVRKSE